jgi:hypothetical protein
MFSVYHGSKTSPDLGCGQCPRRVIREIRGNLSILVVLVFTAAGANSQLETRTPTGMRRDHRDGGDLIKSCAMPRMIRTPRLAPTTTQSICHRISAYSVRCLRFLTSLLKYWLTVT